MHNMSFLLLGVTPSKTKQKVRLSGAELDLLEELTPQVASDSDL